jgi:hypothetical protein
MQGGLAIILLHGRSNGFRAGDYPMSHDDDSAAMFLRRGEMGVFHGKGVFCLSCKGIDHADEAIEKGARVFVGFGDVPFCRFDPVTEEEIPLHSLTKHCQRLILPAVLVTLERIITHDESFDEAVAYMRLWVRCKAVEFVRQNNSEEHRNDIARLFLKMAETVHVSGDGSLRFQDLI